jgi:hypothetical protein
VPLLQGLFDRGVRREEREILLRVHRIRIRISPRNILMELTLHPGLMADHDGDYKEEA